MRTFIFAILCVLITTSIVAQESIKEIQLADGNTILLGSIPVQALQKEPYSSWYTTNYNEYKPDMSRISGFQEALKEYHILVFLGTWCEDRQWQVPGFIKILDAAAFPKDQIKMDAVDKREEFYKQSPGGEEWGLNINFVPTFIFLKDGKEAGRIVEFPDNTLEMDMQSIVTKQ